MKIHILSGDGKEKSSTELPEQFNETVRTDLIKRAVLAIQAMNRQPYGASPEAGKRASAYLSKRRRNYRGTYGIGQSRTPRKIMSRSGTRIYYVGAFAPQTVGGRRAHPPKASKIWEKKINEKENRKAIRSALSATMNKEIVKARGHKVPNNYPFIISDSFESIKKTSELKKSLDTLGFQDEMKRAQVKKVRAGIGKLRGRKYKKKTSILFVVSKECDLMKSANNLPGTEAVLIDNINAELLAPGAEPGRLTLFTEGAIAKLKETKMFTKDFKGAQPEKKQETSAPKKETPKPVKKVVKKVAKKKEGEQQ